MRRSRNNLENDCLALLNFVAKHPGFEQTTESLGCALNMSHQRVSYIIGSVDKWGPNESVLVITANKYGFLFKVVKNQRGRLIDVVYRGRVYNN